MIPANPKILCFLIPLDFNSEMGLEKCSSQRGFCIGQRYAYGIGVSNLLKQAPSRDMKFTNFDFTENRCFRSLCLGGVPSGSAYVLPVVLGFLSESACLNPLLMGSFQRATLPQSYSHRARSE